MNISKDNVNKVNVDLRHLCWDFGNIQFIYDLNVRIY